jgi:hypothetical protein
MPRGPKGEKRPAHVIANAAHMMRIGTGDIEESAPSDRCDLETSRSVMVQASLEPPAENRDVVAEGLADPVSIPIQMLAICNDDSADQHNGDAIDPDHPVCIEGHTPSSHGELNRL